MTSSGLCFVSKQLACKRLASTSFHRQVLNWHAACTTMAWYKR